MTCKELWCYFWRLFRSLEKWQVACKTLNLCNLFDIELFCKVDKLWLNNLHALACLPPILLYLFHILTHASWCVLSHRTLIIRRLILVRWEEVGQHGKETSFLLFFTVLLCNLGSILYFLFICWLFLHLFTLFLRDNTCLWLLSAVIPCWLLHTGNRWLVLCCT